ncbi:PhlD [Streptomyces lydicus]|uniref:PhlD n=1 Tax=Streptomyces lydicus TaxID=47763 RepID=UPI00379A2D8F
MPAHVTRPAIVHPPYWVTTDEICSNIAAHHPDHPRLEVALRIIRNTGVQKRAFAHPLDSELVSGNLGFFTRNAAAWTDTKRLAEQAAQQAITQAGLTPPDIDAVVTSHTTSWSVPQLDVHLIEALALRPDVRRLALTTLGCIGGTQALAKAADLIAARPGTRILVVVSEVISTTYNHDKTSIQSMIYKGLFGDSAAACIVTDTPLSPGLRIDDSWEYLLPGSQDTSYWGAVDQAGFDFDSHPDAKKAPGRVMPALRDWLKQRDALNPDFAITHAGGPAILTAVEKGGLGITRDHLAPSQASLEQVGNLGGASALDVLRRTHDTPPPAGDGGVMLAFGPGFTTTALTGTWVA